MNNGHHLTKVWQHPVKTSTCICQ